MEVKGFGLDKGQQGQLILTSKGSPMQKSYTGKNGTLVLPHSVFQSFEEYEGLLKQKKRKSRKPRYAGQVGSHDLDFAASNFSSRNNP